MSDRTTVAFRNKLRRAGMTADDLAEYIGRDKRTVRRWANGQRAIPGYAWLLLDALIKQRRPEP